MTRTKNKGFTLIELLIVIAIIGLLSTLALVSLTSAQQRARDTKRVADVKAMQTAMELYWNENAAYPAVIATTTWSTLESDLTDFLSALPVDPEHTAQVYFYGVASNATAAEYLQEYVVGATIENTGHQGLSQDVDGNAGTVPADYNSVTSTNTVATGSAVSCADPIYCLTGVATP